MNFDIYSCYVGILGPKNMEEECEKAIIRVVFTPMPAVVIARIAEKLSPQKDIVVKTYPNPADIEVARDFLLLSGAQTNFTLSSYSWRLQKVVDWMQKSPDSPPELIGQYQVSSPCQGPHIWTRIFRRIGPPNLMTISDGMYTRPLSPRS